MSRVKPAYRHEKIELLKIPYPTQKVGDSTPSEHDSNIKAKNLEDISNFHNVGYSFKTSKYL